MNCFYSSCCDRFIGHCKHPMVVVKKLHLFSAQDSGVVFVFIRAKRWTPCRNQATIEPAAFALPNFLEDENNQQDPAYWGPLAQHLSNRYSFHFYLNVSVTYSVSTKVFKRDDKGNGQLSPSYQKAAFMFQNCLLFRAHANMRSGDIVSNNCKDSLGHPECALNCFIMCVWN